MLMMKCCSIYLITAMAIILIIIPGCGTTVMEYEPRDSKEAEIKSLLIKYAAARNTQNVKNYLA